MLLEEQFFRLISYNILANSYTNPEWYTHVNSEALAWGARRLALTERIKRLDADVICLQEVEEDAYTLIDFNLRKKGYTGVYAKKGCDKPDGCATFFRHEVMHLLSNEVVYYSDELHEVSRSGHLAIICSFASELGVLRIINTHLKWDGEEKPPECHVGYRQIRELINKYVKADRTTYAWIVCGDLNAQFNSPIVEALINNLFEDAYKGCEQNTCNPNRRAKRIDYILYTAGLRAIPERLKEIDDLTPLPSLNEPSDHLPIAATLQVAPGYEQGLRELTD
ncbi:MAG: endonuclease/exonuclease/phosphatase family protein [Chitinophagaceae bacterium]